MKNEGFLPVTILQGTIFHWLQEIDNVLKQELSNAVDFGDLNAAVKYKIENKPGVESPEITPSHTIKFTEKHFQYFWCVSFYLYVFFKEGIIDKIENDTYDGMVDADDNNYMLTAIEVIKAGESLKKEFNPTLFYQLPNPETPSGSFADYIGKANGIFTAGIIFNFVHEYGHHYYRHEDYIPESDAKSKLEEFLADDLALEKISLILKTEKKDTIQFGILANYATIIFLNNSFDGGSSHPDTHERIEKSLSHFDLHEGDPLWMLATFVYLMATKRMGINLRAEEDKISFKNQFLTVHSDLISRLEN